jgi:hypothetical protein
LFGDIAKELLYSNFPFIVFPDFLTVLRTKGKVISKFIPGMGCVAYWHR